MSATGTAIRILNVITPKRSRRAVLYGMPPLNDAVVAVLTELTKRGVQCDVLVDTPAEVERLRERATGLGAVGIHARRSPAAVRRFTRARHVFITHGLYDVPGGPRQRVVNLWHGEFTKRIDERPVPSSLRTAIATATSRLGVALRSMEFDLPPDRVLLVGNPRNDRLLATTKAEARDRLGLAASGRLLLWVPTYRVRATGNEGPPSPTPAELERLDAWLATRDTTLLVKHHPMTPRGSERPELANVRYLDDSAPGQPMSVADLLAACDGLITDFSSAWVDFLLLDRPIWIHWPDHAVWSEANIPPLSPVENWTPGPLSDNLDALIDGMRAYLDDGVDDWAERRAWLRPVLHTYVDTHNTERLLDALQIAAPGATRLPS